MNKINEENLDFNNYFSIEYFDNMCEFIEETTTINGLDKIDYKDYSRKLINNYRNKIINYINEKNRNNENNENNEILIFIINIYRKCLHLYLCKFIDKIKTKEIKKIVPKLFYILGIGSMTSWRSHLQLEFAIYIRKVSKSFRYIFIYDPIIENNEEEKIVKAIYGNDDVYFGEKIIFPEETCNSFLYTPFLNTSIIDEIVKEYSLHENVYILSSYKHYSAKNCYDITDYFSLLGANYLYSF